MPERIYALLTFTLQDRRNYPPHHSCRDVENNRQNLPLRGIICRVRPADFAGPRHRRAANVAPSAREAGTRAKKWSGSVGSGRSAP
jgi:hypothetical protein